MLDVRGSCFDRIIMTLHAYLDDSGHYDDPNEIACIVGGFIASVGEWNSLEKEWFEALSVHNVTEFHSVDIEHGQEDFRGWTKRQREDFVSDMLAVILKHLKAPSKPIGSLLPKNQFSSLEREKQHEWGGDPYFVCLQDAIESAVTHTCELYGPTESIIIMCDQQPNFQTIAERVYKACRANFTHGGQLSGFGFYPSDKYAGLQVADLVAYEALKLRREMDTGNDNLVDELRPTMDRLMSFQSDFEFYTVQKLWEREPLINYSLS
jgi:hypothetical protein